MHEKVFSEKLGVSNIIMTIVAIVVVVVVLPIAIAIIALFVMSLISRGFSFYKMNTNIWQNRIAIIINFIAKKEIKEYAQCKRIVSIFKKGIDNLNFLSSNLSNLPLSNSTVLYK